MFVCCAKSHIYEHYIILYRKRKCFSHVFCDLAKLFAPQAKHNNIFARGVYVGENTSQAANVRIVRIAGDECAAAGCKTSKKMPCIFFDSKKNPAANCSGSLRSKTTQRQIL